MAPPASNAPVPATPLPAPQSPPARAAESDLELQIRTVASLRQPYQIDCVAISGDGSRVALGGGSLCKIFDVKSRVEVGTVDLATAKLRSCALSADGSLLAFGANDDAFLWDVAASRVRRSIVEDNRGHTKAVRFLNNSDRIATGNFDGKVSISDVADERPIMMSQSDRTKTDLTGIMFYSVAASDTLGVVASSSLSDVKIWKKRDLLPDFTIPFSETTFGESAIAVSPDGRIVAAARQHKILVIDSESGTQRELADLSETYAVSELLFLPGNSPRVLALAGKYQNYFSKVPVDFTASIWDVQTGQCTGRSVVKVDAAPRMFFHVANATPDGRFAVVKLDHKRADVVELLFSDPPPAPPQKTTQPLRTLKGHQAPVWCVAFGADGQTIVSGSGELKERVDDSLRTWDAASGAELRKFSGHKGRVLSVACAAQGTEIVSADQEGRLCHWNAADARSIREWSPRGWHCAKFAGDGRRILVGGQDFLGWQNLTGNDPPRKFALGGGLVWSLALDETNTRVLSAGGLVNTFRLWDAERGTATRVFEGHTGVVEGVAFTPDGKHAVSSSHDSSVRLWEVATGRQVRRFRGHERAVFCVAVSPDGSRIASGGSDATVRVWDIETGHELIRGEGHGGDVRAVAFSPDGRTVVSGSVDWTVREWAITDR